MLRVLLLSLLLSALAQAQPAALLVRLEGRVAHSFGNPALLGALLESGTVLILAPGAELSLLYFADSHLEKVTGPLRLSVDLKGSTSLGGTGRLAAEAAPRGGTRDPLVANVARMAGRAERGGDVPFWVPDSCPEVRSLAVRRSANHERLESLEWTSENPGPFLVEVCGLGPSGPDLPLWSRVVNAHKSGAWRVPYDGPALTRGLYLARVGFAQGTHQQFGEQRFGLLSAEEYREWEALRARLQSWAERSPKDPTPLRVLAGGALFYGLVEEAASALNRALPHCRGLSTTQAVQLELDRLMRELGR